MKTCCLNLTDACNCACKYCFVHQQPHYMALDTAKKAVEYFATIEDKGTITYFGGEPTLCWDSIIVPLTLWIKENYPERFGLTVTTNGTLLNQERIDFMREHRIIPLLSMDGSKEIQDYNRPLRDGGSSYDLIAPNISYLLKKFPDTTFRATIHENMADKVLSTYLFAREAGFRNFFITPNCRSTWSRSQLNSLSASIDQLFLYFVCEMEESRIPLSFKTLNESFEWVLRRDLEIVHKQENDKIVRRSGYRCGLGTTSYSVAWNGDIYGCQEQDSYADHDSIFYIGDIYNGIDKKRHEALLSRYREAVAAVCEILEYCGGCPMATLCQEIGCPSVNWDLFQNFHKNPYILCFWQRRFFENAATTMNLLVRDNNKLFKEYLYHNCNYKSYWKEEDYFGLSEL